MVDNVQANAGAGGAVFAADDIGGVHYPRVKLVWGADGSANDASAANPIPVVQTGALPAGANNIGTVELSATALAALETITVASITAPLAGGTNNIGDVDVLTLPSIPAGNNNIGDVDVASVAAGAIIEVQGDVAHDAPAAGNPVLIGVEARNADRTAVANADATRLTADLQGKLVVQQGCVPELHLDDRLNRVDNVAANVLNAPGAGRRIAVQSIMVINAHPSVSTKVEIRRATTVKLIGFAAANGGGFVYQAGGAILFFGGDNEAITARCVTTGADVDIFVTGYSLPI